MATEKENECIEHDSDILPDETDEQENSWYTCHVHGKDFMPLLCKDCESTVCFDCIVTTHVGHNMCKISDGIEDKMEKINDAIQRKESACFDLNELKEQLQKRRHNVKNQKELMVQRVTDREEEIVKEVKNICLETKERISSLATKIEGPMVKDEELLNSLIECDLLEKDNDKDCIKAMYVFKKLKLFDGKNATENREELPFVFVTHELPPEKMHALVESLITDGLLLSDDNVEISETGADISRTNSTNKQVVQPSMHQKKVLDGDINAVMLISPEKRLLFSKGTLYHQSNEMVDKVLDNIDRFTYFPKLEEIIFTLRSSSNEKRKCIWRQPLTNKEQRTSFMTLHCELIVAISHGDTYYLSVLFVTSQVIDCGVLYKDIQMGLIDDTGCKHKPFLSLGKINCNFITHFKLMNFSVIIFKKNSVTVCKELTLTDFFSYSGSVGNLPARTFSPIDLCVDPDGNFLVTDSFDSTVHLLDPTGKFMRIIMSAEDGLRDVCCVSMDVFGWLWFGCKDGLLRFANYTHFKSTTREDRRSKKVALI